MYQGISTIEIYGSIRINYIKETFDNAQIDWLAVLFYGISTLF